MTQDIIGVAKMRWPAVFMALILFLLIGCKHDVEISDGVVHTFSTESISQGQFSDDGKLLLGVTGTGSVMLWRVDSQQVEFKIPDHKVLKPVKHVVLSKDKSLILVANDNTVGLWSVPAKAMISKVKFSGVSARATITAMALSPHKDRLLVGMADGSLNMADINTRLNNRFKPHSQPIRHLKFDTQGALFLSGGLDGKIGLWQFGSSAALFEQEFAHRVTSLATTRDFSRFFVSDGLSAQHIKQLTSGAEQAKLNYSARFKIFRQSTFVENGALLATSSSKSHLSLWHTETGEELGTWTIQTKNKGASIVAMHADNHGNLFTFNSDAVLERWNLDLIKAL